ncbi:hypothetical protein ACHAWU_006790 [Discostella pseudostelligera]|uniref:Uncharacterized protein n=1 Tax=Discostella pseudostelligera TaxID=259834 RepID=A0ABD3MZA5_9STRA
MSGIMVHEPMRSSSSAFQMISSMPSPIITTATKYPSSVSSASHDMFMFASLLTSSSSSSSSSSSLSAENRDDENSSSPPSSLAEQILHDFHASKLSFRIIVIGNGAILESTSPLGPTFKPSISPKSGERLITFANMDASLEFHVKVDEIAKIVFVVSQSNDQQQQQQSRRVARFINANGIPICSLLLAETTKEGEAWFENMMETYGNEVVM